MSIPLDRLHPYIENISTQISQDRVIIYRFFPHGSKKLNNLIPLVDPLDYYDPTARLLSIPIYCNDQEPLNYQFYEHESQLPESNFLKVLITESLINPPNLKIHATVYDCPILLHSEKRSTEVDKYCNDFITAYYWSHAIIARDWFRFAQHIQQQKQVNKTFLIYNRAWSGTREYRLKFTDFLIKSELENNCKMSINPVEPELGIHYKLHDFSNLAWQPTEVLENYFSTSSAHSYYSADFDIKDYEATDIEVVLETLFDDTRLHLTEKSLRPIACAQPFILVGTHGSLEYLRGYGFKTFGDIWDERYDLVEDPKERLISIIDLMKQIANWSPEIKEQKLVQAQAIADYNKKYFFSDEFFNIVINELTENLSKAINQLITTNTFDWARRWELYLKNDNVQKYVKNPINEFVNVEQLNKIVKLIKNHYIPRLLSTKINS